MFNNDLFMHVSMYICVQTCRVGAMVWVRYIRCHQVLCLVEGDEDREEGQAGKLFCPEWQGGIDTSYWLGPLLYDEDSSHHDSFFVLFWCQLCRLW